MDIGMNMRASPSTKTIRGLTVTDIIRIIVRGRDNTFNLVPPHMIGNYTNTEIILT